MRVGWDSSVGIVTCHVLDGPGLNPGGGDTPVPTGPWFHPASHTMGTGSFPGLKRPGHGIDHPPPSSIKVKTRVELTSPPRLALCGLL